MLWHLITRALTATARSSCLLCLQPAFDQLRQREAAAAVHRGGAALRAAGVRGRRHPVGASGVLWLVAVLSEAATLISAIIRWLLDDIIYAFVLRNPLLSSQPADNDVILQLIENKPGIFPLLDDVCVMADATSDKLLHAFDGKLAKNEYYIANRVKDGTFSVQHYAGAVTYTTRGMIDDNRRMEIPCTSLRMLARIACVLTACHLACCFNHAFNRFLFNPLSPLQRHAVFGSHQPDAQVKGLPAAARAVCGQALQRREGQAPAHRLPAVSRVVVWPNLMPVPFVRSCLLFPLVPSPFYYFSSLCRFRASVNKLIEVLSECQPHYVRCIKPNPNKAALAVDDELFANQVRRRMAKVLYRLSHIRYCVAAFLSAAMYSIFQVHWISYILCRWPTSELWRARA